MINRPSSGKTYGRPTSAYSSSNNNNSGTTNITSTSRKENADHSSSSLPAMSNVNNNNNLHSILNTNSREREQSPLHGTTTGHQQALNTSSSIIQNDRSFFSNINLNTTTNNVYNSTTAVMVNNNNNTISSALSPSSSFYVILNGVISYCEYPGNHNISCSFQFVYGQDWEVVRSTGEGASLESGITQVAMRPRGINSKSVWNFPLEISFRSTNPYGWPKLCLVVQEGTSKQTILGYGWVQVPVGAGKHTRTVKLFKPQSTSLIQKIIGSVKGVAPEYFDSTLVCKGEGREVTRTECVGGEVTVEFNIMHKGMSQFGFETFSQQ
ncbi:hypothetical protein C9374_000641 [Naegleria lovaniensis]|uniref:B9 domain-containing protein 1 n=1 Tax=Naegleria lovaniensis TaxID=51637 RepID=A0AA88GT90_NAELO|nr:uncharacterized protein C9374_000641 [Naegleria lovaniensis]KAG2388477.1 hypothetical protein C9374_000641 [Naegleria lovaniensis]